MERSSAEKVIHGYEQAGRDIIEMLEEKTNYDDISKLKGKL